jgi:hypothetical protein
MAVGMSRPAGRPKLYDDPPGTKVDPLGYGYELVQRPGARTFCRRALSTAGKRKHDRLETLGELGYEVISTRGPGMVVHPSDPDHLWSIAAAAVHEGLADDGGGQ